MTARRPAARVERRLLNYNDVADYLSVSVRTAKQLAADGEFPKVTIGARVLFDREDIDAYVSRIKDAS